jgi:hypothetical protein
VTTREMLDDGWITKNTGTYLLDEWMDLFGGDLSFVMVLAIYAYRGQTDKFSHFDAPKIREFLHGGLSEKTIRHRRKQLIALGALETEGKSGRGREGEPCRVCRETIRAWISDPLGSREMIAGKLAEAAEAARRRRQQRPKQQGLFNPAKEQVSGSKRPTEQNQQHTVPQESGKDAIYKDTDVETGGKSGTGDLNNPALLPVNPEVLPVHIRKDAFNLASNNLASWPSAPEKPNLPDSIRGVLADHKFLQFPEKGHRAERQCEGSTVSDHTVKVLTGIIGALPAVEQPLELAELADRCRGYVKDRREKTLGWGAVVNDTKSAVRNRAHLAYAPPPVSAPISEVAGEPIDVSDLPSADIRASYTADQIQQESRLWLLNPCGLDIKREFELDRQRRQKSAAHAEAVDRRWQLPLFASPNLDWNDPKYADRWQWDHFMHLPWPELTGQRKPMGRQEAAQAFAASAARA